MLYQYRHPSLSIWSAPGIHSPETLLFGKTLNALRMSFRCIAAPSDIIAMPSTLSAHSLSLIPACPGIKMVISLILFVRIPPHPVSSHHSCFDFMNYTHGVTETHISIVKLLMVIMTTNVCNVVTAAF